MSCSLSRGTGKIFVPGRQHGVQEVAVITDVFNCAGFRQRVYKFEAGGASADAAGGKDFAFPQNCFVSWTVALMADPVKPGFTDRFSCFHAFASPDAAQSTFVGLTPGMAQEC